MARQVINNMSKGELSPELHGRIDTTQYASSVETAINWVIHKSGGMFSRPGTELIGEADTADTLEDNVRLIPFDYGLDFAYVLAAHDGIARPMSSGGFVVEDDLKVEAVETGSKTVVTVSYHGFRKRERVFLTGIEGMTELNGQIATVRKVLDLHTVQLDLNSQGYSPYTGSSGEVRTEVYAPPVDPPEEPPEPPPPAPTPPPVGGPGGPGDFR